MAAGSVEAERFRSRLKKAGRRFYAWWEGYAYDDDGAALDEIAARRGASRRPVELEIPERIWGLGRTDPGDPAFTLRAARALGVSTRAHVVVFGAGLGGPLRDLKTGTRWKTFGLTRTPAQAPGLDLKSYEAALTRLQKSAADGGLCLFEVHRDADPCGFVRFASELLRAGAPLAFVDFATARKSVRLYSCFPDIAPGAPRAAADYQRVIKDAGLLAGDAIDETRSFLPLIARGWSRWRQAYDAAARAADDGARAGRLRFFADYARLWAERLDALRSGHLRVVRLMARKPRI